MNPKKLIVAAAIVAAAFTARAQTALDYPNIVSASTSTVDDGDIALVCWYVGTGAGGFLTIAADGNLAFESPDVSTADTTFECPVSGGLGGIIDVSDAACNTVTEVLNIINTPSSNFRCVAHAILGADDINIGGTGWLKAASDESCAMPAGCAVETDTDTAFSMYQVVARPADFALASKYGVTGPGTNGQILGNGPFTGLKGFLSSVSFTNTYGSGTSLMSVYAVKDEYRPTYSATTGKLGATFVETATLLWGPTAVGLTTAEKVFGSCDTAATACDPAWGSFGLISKYDEKLVVRVVNSAAMATATLKINGALVGR